MKIGSYDWLWEFVELGDFNETRVMVHFKDDAGKRREAAVIINTYTVQNMIQRALKSKGGKAVLGPVKVEVEE